MKLQTVINLTSNCHIWLYNRPYEACFLSVKNETKEIANTFNKYFIILQIQ